MELDFDKEIDTLLRKTRRDGPVLIGDHANTHHLDADEISAFAENAMPENSRALYSAHLAECDRCRKILSNLLMMNAEAAPAESAAGAVAITAAVVPWYRRLFLFPNLAYVMGGLVLIFGGFLAFTVVQNSRVSDTSMISQTAETETTQGGPHFDSEPSFVGNSNMSATANSMANTAAPAPGIPASNSNAARTALALGDNAERAGRDEKNFAADGTPSTDVVVTGGAPTAAAPLPPPATTANEVSRVREADLPKAKAEEKSAAYEAQELAKKDAVLRQQSPGALNSTQSGPMRNNENAYNRQLENLDKRQAAAAKKMPARRDEDSGSGRRVVGGKTFERKQGVWYDTSYQGRPTINVRRGSDEFNRLDGGLRSIGNSLSGTVVVVWGAKAYRIQ